jgi:transketolase
MALGFIKAKQDRHVFCLISDGELNEGTTWESALIGSALGLTNISVLIDYNKIQSFGRVDEVLPIEPLSEKWKSFGWDTKIVNGHDFSELRQSVVNITNRTVLILDTIKGKGVSFMEDKLEWHYKSPDKEEVSKAISEILKGLD